MKHVVVCDLNLTMNIIIVFHFSAFIYMYQVKLFIVYEQLDHLMTKGRELMRGGYYNSHYNYLLGSFSLTWLFCKIQLSTHILFALLTTPLVAVGETLTKRERED